MSEGRLQWCSTGFCSWAPAVKLIHKWAGKGAIQLEGNLVEALHIAGVRCLICVQSRPAFCWNVSICLHWSFTDLCERPGESQTGTTEGKRWEDQGQVVRNVCIRNQSGLWGMPLWGYLRGRWTCSVMSYWETWREKEMDRELLSPGSPPPGFLFLLLGMVGEVYQEIPWHTETSDGEGITKNKLMQISGGARRRPAAWHKLCAWSGSWLLPNGQSTLCITHTADLRSISWPTYLLEHHFLASIPAGLWDWLGVHSDSQRSFILLQ